MKLNLLFQFPVGVYATLLWLGIACTIGDQLGYLLWAGAALVFYVGAIILVILERRSDEDVV